jgi:hypothetical protein
MRLLYQNAAASPEKEDPAADIYFIIEIFSPLLA